MQVRITLRGTLRKYFGNEKEKIIEVPEDCTAEDALKLVGIDWTKIDNFGFVAINGMRVMIYDKLKDGDELKAYSKISGG